MFNKNVFGLALVVALTGCHSTMTVTPVTPANDAAVKGQRYSLPKTYLVLTPKSDGSLEYKIEYLADPNKTYAVDAKSYAFMTHKLSLETDERGILKSLAWNKDSSGFATDVITAGSEFRKAEIEQTIADRKTAQESADKAAAAIAATANAKTAAENEKRVADELVSELEGKLSSEQMGPIYIRQAEAKAQLEQITSSSEDAADELQVEIVTAQNSSGLVFSETYGAQWYSVNFSTSSVELREAMPQIKADTIDVGNVYPSTCAKLQALTIKKSELDDVRDGFAMTVQNEQVKGLHGLRYRSEAIPWTTADDKVKLLDVNRNYEIAVKLLVDFDNLEPGRYEVELQGELNTMKGNANCVRGSIDYI